MTLSNRLALLGVRSVSKSRGFGSSYGLIDRRPFQISKFTNDSNPSSKNSRMESIRDSSPEITDDYLRNLIEEVRAEVEKMRTEQAKAGFIYLYTLQLSMEINDYNNTMSRHIRDLRANVADTSRQIAIWGTATAVLTPAIIFAIALFSL